LPVGNGVFSRRVIREEVDYLLPNATGVCKQIFQEK